MIRLAIVCTHPIQYNAPLFVYLAKHIQLKVFYTWEKAQEQIYDKDFGRKINWNLNLLSEYEYVFVPNPASNQDSKSFWGIRNPQLISILKTWKPDAILVYGWNHLSHLQVMHYFHGKIPVLFRGDSIDIGGKSNWKKNLRKWILKLVYQNIDYALYVGKLNKDYFINKCLKESQLVYVPHCVENKRFYHLSKKELATINRQKYNLNDKPLLFVFAGKFMAIKNLDFILRIAQEEDSRLQQINWLVVGDGNEKYKIDELKRRKTNLHTLAFQAQDVLPEIFGMADVIVLPSLGDTWGLVVNEAMACGLAALVSTSCGCQPDLVISAYTGESFSAENYDDFVEATLRMISSLPDLEKMKKNSLEHIQNFSIENAGNMLVSHLNKIITR